MLELIYNRIKNNTAKSGDTSIGIFENQVSLMALFFMNCGAFLVSLLFLAQRTIGGMRELVILNLILAALELGSIIVTLLTSKYMHAIYSTLTWISFYIIFYAAIMGYDKNTLLIIPPVFICIFSAFNIDRKHSVLALIILIFDCVCLFYIRDNMESSYTGQFMHMEIINLIFALCICLYAIFTKKASKYYIEKYHEAKINTLENEAYTDYLTGLWNRRYVEDVFQNSIDKDSDYVVLADIDFFKKVNDTYGHDVGDDVIKRLAQIYVRFFRDTDLICRWGGEEYLFIIKGIEEEVILKKLNDLRMDVSKCTFKYEDFSFNITVSFGLKSIEDRHNVDADIKCADLALYKAKNNGRNQVVLYNETMKDMYKK